MIDTISRREMIDFFLDKGMITSAIYVERMPSVQLTLDGYNIDQLLFIAKLLAKENIPPEMVSEVLSDMGKVVAIVKKEFEEALRKAVERCVS